LIIVTGFYKYIALDLRMYQIVAMEIQIFIGRRKTDKLPQREN